jgi:hypothetical protein
MSSFAIGVLIAFMCSAAASTSSTVIEAVP